MARAVKSPETWALWRPRPRCAVAPYSRESCISALPYGIAVGVQPRAQLTFGDHALSWVAVSMPFAIAVARASSAVQWRGDLAAVRDQGLVSVGVGGALSTMVQQAMTLLPLGAQPFRASVGSALALLLACAMLLRIARRLLSLSTLSTKLVSVLAAVATVTAGFSPSWQAEATVGGGTLLAAALALCGIDRALSLSSKGVATLTPAATRGWLVLAALTGATLAENLPCGLALMAVVLATTATAGKWPPLRLAPALAVIAVLVFGLLCAPAMLRQLAPRAWSDLGRALSGATLTALDVDPTRKTALIAWVQEVGFVSLGLAALGVVVGVFRDDRRASMSALVTLAVLDLVYPLSATTGVEVEPLAALRLLTLAAFALAAGLGVAEVVSFLTRLDVPMVRAASLLLVVFHMTVVAVTCEEAAFSADRSQHFAAEEWTDEALGRLPLGSAVVVHSPELAWRLWSEQTLRGGRPDVLVIPAPLLRRGIVTANLVPTEPAVAQILRDLALTGKASEFGLSALADARPLFVELDRDWDKRVVTHVTIDGPWLRYAPQALSRSDRKLPRHHALALEGRITAQITSGDTPDPSTAQVVSKTLKEHVAALSLVGMGQSSLPWLDGVERLSPSDAFVTGARLRLAHAERVNRSGRAVELRDLLRF
jgi:hypothetical protein